MVTPQPEPEVVSDVGRCQTIVSGLMKCDVIAMDAEGVQLGKDGTMTLLQIGIVEHKFYLFDVQETRNFSRKDNLEIYYNHPGQRRYNIYLFFNCHRCPRFWNYRVSYTIIRSL